MLLDGDTDALGVRVLDAVAEVDGVGITGAAATPTQRMLASGAQGRASTAKVRLDVKNCTSPMDDVSRSDGSPSTSGPPVRPRTPPKDGSTTGKPGATVHADDTAAEGRVNWMSVGAVAVVPALATYMTRPRGSIHKPAAVVELVLPPGRSRLSVYSPGAVPRDAAEPSTPTAPAVDTRCT